MTGSFMLFYAENIDKAREMLENDIYTKGGESDSRLFLSLNHHIYRRGVGYVKGHNNACASSEALTTLAAGGPCYASASRVVQFSTKRC